MNPVHRKTIILLVLGLSTTALVCHQLQARNDSRPAEARTDPTMDTPQRGSPAPDFTLPDVHGHRVSLSSLRGQTIVLGFFCGCDRCHKAAVRIAALQKQGKLKHFVAVVGLTPIAAEELQKHTGFQGTVLCDPSDQVTEQYQSLFCPRFWMLSYKGTLQYGSDKGLEGKLLNDALASIVRTSSKVSYAKD